MTLEVAPVPGVLPTRWRNVSLGDLADFINGRAFKPSDWTSSGTPIIRIQNLNGGADFNYYAGEVDPRFRVGRGDLLFSWSGTRGTSFGPHMWRGPEAILNQHIFNLRNLRDVEQGFLFHALKRLTSAVEKRAHGGTGIVHITKGELESFRLGVPPLPEQRRITAILSSVDAAIEATQSVIDQIQVVKNAMMAELLTRGLPGRHTRFKQTEIGEVPEEWEILSLADISAGGLKNGVFKKKTEFGNGAPLVNVVDVYRGVEVDASGLGRVRVSPEERANFGAEVGDVFFVRSSLKLEGIGHCCVVTSSPEPMVFECHIIRIRPDVRRVNSLFLCYQGLSDVCRRQIMSHAKTTTMTTIGQDGLGSVRVAVPSLDEQQLIASSIRSVEDTTTVHAAERDALLHLKNALTGVLLTGELRVCPDEVGLG